MKLLFDVQAPNSEIKTYTKTLNKILDHKVDMILGLKKKVERF